jgi:hypothetical protein
MLCESCDRNNTCLPSVLAKTDERLENMLNNLEQCDMRTEEQPNPHSQQEWLRWLDHQWSRLSDRVRLDFKKLVRN